MTEASLFAAVSTLRTKYLDDLNRTVLARRAFENEKTAAQRRSEGWPPDLHPITGADVGSIISLQIMEHWAAALPGSLGALGTAQKSGATFESILVDFLNDGFSMLRENGVSQAADLFAARKRVLSEFDQYAHLATIDAKLESDPGLENVFGRDYNVRPDVVVYRRREDPGAFGGRENDTVARYSPFFIDAHHAAYEEPGYRGVGVSGDNVLHAIVSCKFSIRSDRAQNIRTEAITAMRMRKGRLPHIVAVTAEPMCSRARLESIASGTGEIDCVYHSALVELANAMECAGAGRERQRLENLIRQRRIRDVSDLIFDLLM